MATSDRLDASFEATNNAQLPTPKPLSFAQMTQKSRPPPGFEPKERNAAQNTDKTQNLPKLKRWPKNKDPKVLSSYLELELKNKDRLRFFTDISGAGKNDKRLIIMRGVPGSGKSVLSILLAGVTERGIILSADDYFLDSRGVYQFDPENLGKAHETCQNKCKRAMTTQQNPIIIDNTNTMIWEMIPYVKMALAFDYKVHVIEPVTPWKSNAKILAQRNTHGVPFNKIKSMLDRFDKNVTSDLLIGVARNGKDKTERDLVTALDNLTL